jgi:NADH-quinone oxidoreductase subunit F
MEKILSIGEFEWYRNKICAQEDEGKTHIDVCMTGCRAYGAAELRAALEEEVKKQGLSSQIEIRSTGCHGICAKAPVMYIDPLGVQYQEVNPEDAAEIVDLTLKKNQLIDHLAYRDALTGNPIYYRNQIPFYEKQVKRVLANCALYCQWWISGYCQGPL